MSKIYLDAGHGGTDPGAVKYVVEKDVAIKVVKHCYNHLRDYYNCGVIADTSADSTKTIAQKANKYGADLFVSVHFNAGGGDGFEALVYNKANKKLGTCFEKRVLETGQNSRGVKYRPDLNVLKYTKMPAVLCEIAFVDNKKDIQDWDEDRELKVMGQALAKAAADWLKLEAKDIGKYKTLTDLNLRKKASLDSSALAVVPEGTVLSGTPEGSWLKTKYNGKEGYVRIEGQKVYCKKV